MVQVTFRVRCQNTQPGEKAGGSGASPASPKPWHFWRVPWGPNYVKLQCLAPPIFVETNILIENQLFSWHTPGFCWEVDYACCIHRNFYSSYIVYFVFARSSNLLLSSTYPFWKVLESLSSKLGISQWCKLGCHLHPNMTIALLIFGDVDVRKNHGALKSIPICGCYQLRLGIRDLSTQSPEFSPKYFGFRVNHKGEKITIFWWTTCSFMEIQPAPKKGTSQSKSPWLFLIAAPDSAPQVIYVCWLMLPPSI